MDDKKINEKESLEIITAMIERTKERYMLGEGNILLLWGYLTLTVSLLIWALLVITYNPAVNWLWYLIWIIGGIATPILQKKKQVQKGALTYTDKIVSRLWMAVGFCALGCTLACLGLYFLIGAGTWVLMLEFALLIVPFAEIANGIVLNEKSLIWGGSVGIGLGFILCCCIGSRISAYAMLVMPFFCMAYICMMIIPGHIINRKAKRAL